MLAEYEDPGLDPARDEALLAYMAQRKAVLTDSVEEE
jgi:trimethylamine:corrinoid methyltransferase-like protein